MPTIGESRPDPIFKSLIWDVLISALLKWVFSRVPILGLGPIPGVIGFFLSPVFDELYRMLWEVIDIPRVFIRSESLRLEYTKSALELKRIAGEHGDGSEEFAKALRLDQQRFFDFVVLGQPL